MLTIIIALGFAKQKRIKQGHPMDLFLKISVLQGHFCWLGDVEEIIVLGRKVLKIVSENFIHALLLFLCLFLKISRWVPLIKHKRK